jgi:hypothetical protein
MTNPPLDYLQVFRFIITYKTENDGNSPTIRAIKEGLNYASTSSTWRMVRKLADIGLIELRNSTIHIPGGVWFHPLLTSPYTIDYLKDDNDDTLSARNDDPARYQKNCGYSAVISKTKQTSKHARDMLDPRPAPSDSATIPVSVVRRALDD